MKTIIGMILVILTANTYADTLSVHCPYGCPTSPTNNDLIFTHLYALSNNPVTKFADWVAYEVDVLNFGPSPGRTWKSDPLLDKSETLEKEDYKTANKMLTVDKGHQAPLGSFAGSRYWAELNFLSNITPQKSALNQGPWKRLEGAVRNAVSFRKSLYVITGPLYENARTGLPKADETHTIPSGYFKVIYDTNGAVGFIMNQDTPRDAEYCSKQASLGAIQSKIGFTLPDLLKSTSLIGRLGC